MGIHQRYKGVNRIKKKRKIFIKFNSSFISDVSYDQNLKNSKISKKTEEGEETGDKRKRIKEHEKTDFFYSINRTSKGVRTKTTNVWTPQ